MGGVDDGREGGKGEEAIYQASVWLSKTSEPWFRTLWAEELWGYGLGEDRLEASARFHKNLLTDWPLDEHLEALVVQMAISMPCVLLTVTESHDCDALWPCPPHPRSTHCSA